MINLDFFWALTAYLIIIVAAIFSIWILNKKKEGKDLSLDPKFIWFCNVCTYTYVNTKEESISICPRCGSYNKKQ